MKPRAIKLAMCHPINAQLSIIELQEMLPQLEEISESFRSISHE